MEKTISVLSHTTSKCLSFLSFDPLIKHLKEKQLKTGEDPEAFYNSIQETFSGMDLSSTVTDIKIIKKHDPLINELMNMTFSEANDEINFYAITPPLLNSIVSSSINYYNYFLSGKYDIGETFSFFQVNLETIYQLVIKKSYGLTLLNNNSFYYPVTEKTSGIQKFLEIELIADFINVKLTGLLPELSFEELSSYFSQIKSNKLLEEALPLHLFSFEGIMIIKGRDVTIRESFNTIKSGLITMPHLGDQQTFQYLKKQIQNLVELPEVNIGIASVIRNGDNETGSNVLYLNNGLTQPFNFIRNDCSVWSQLKVAFEERNSILIKNFSGSLLYQFNFLQSFADNHVQSLVLFPLKVGTELIGIFSMFTKGSGSITQKHMYRIEPLIPLLVFALEKQSAKMDDEIDKVIREQFTAVQSSVNWKFTTAARNYINQKNNGGVTKIENIVFENVFPLYGSIDVRNSSVERSTAIQKDLLEQLQLADNIIRKSKKEVYLFSLHEISYRIDKYISIASLVLFPGDELAIQNFLDDEITSLFNHLKKAMPAVRNDIDNYFFLLNTNTNKISKQCAAFEESITMINNELIKFINHEQAKVQEIYAHYFEYFVTDGVDFNIYIGQSITPDKPFDQFYLKNLKLWQLTTLVKAAQKVRNLQSSIPVALDTTQLILAHSKSLSISFRVAERKFDVDGAYNIHYEIIKKRIDKIKIMGSCERLTQPGTIAIVFAHDKEAEEYTSYIKYLQKEGLLDDTIEYFDLEELPGVRGLKALRINIRMDLQENINTVFVENCLLKAVS